MQKREAPSALAARAAVHHLADLHQLLALEAGVVLRALRAIAAILRAAAGLDRQQRLTCTSFGIEMLAVDALRVEQQVAERQRNSARTSSRVQSLRTEPSRLRSGEVMA